jgi:hypothetical protein
LKQRERERERERRRRLQFESEEEEMEEMARKINLILPWKLRVSDYYV